MNSLKDDVSKLQKNKTTCSWLTGYGSIPDIVRSIGARSVLEIGVAYGYHALHLLDNCNVKYVGIDPYPSMYDPSDQFVVDVTRMFELDPREHSDRIAASDRLYQAVAESLTSNNSEAELHRLSFIQFSKAFPGRKFDLIYIDGDHREDAVIVDIVLSLLHVSESGLICGDDIERETVRAGLEKVSSYLGKTPYLHTNAQNGKLTWIMKP
jgi:predicted O-methyltransferase YrrM